MDDNMKVEKWTLEDGRRAERRVVEVKNADGQGEKIVELHVEDERPLKLQQRIIERTKPMLYERKIEVVDPVSGNVVEEKIETLVGAKGGESSFVTKEELLAVLGSLKNKEEVKVLAAAKTEANKKVVKSLGLAEELEKMTKPQKDGMSMMDKVLLVVIAAQIIGLGYILFFM
jgi:hypothetical protein